MRTKTASPQNAPEQEQLTAPTAIQDLVAQWIHTAREEVRTAFIVAWNARLEHPNLSAEEAFGRWQNGREG